MSVHDLVKKWAEETGAGDPKMLAHHLEKLELENKVIPKLYAKDINDGGERRQIFDINSIAVKNLKSVEARELEVKPGITMVYGPNCSGKSTFLDGLELAIKGARGEAVPALMRVGATEMNVVLKATALMIDRTYTKKVVTRGKNTGDVKYEHDLVVHADGSKDNKTEKAQALLQCWADVDLDFVVRCSMVRQGHLAGILEEEAAKRQELFFRLLALGAAEETREAIAKVARDQAAKMAAGQSVVEPARAEVERLKKELSKVPMDKLKSKLAELESTVSTGANRVDKEARLSLIRTAIKQQTRFSEMIAKYSAKIAELNKSPALYLEVIEVAPKLATAEAALRHAIAKVGALEARLDLVMEHGKTVKHTGTYPGTDRPLGFETKAAALASLKSQYAEVKTALEQARAARQEADQLYTHLSAERVRMAHIGAGKAGIQSAVGAMMEIRTSLEQLVQLFDMKGAQADAEQLEKLCAADAADANLLEEIAAGRKVLAHCQSLEVQIGALEKTIAQATAPVADAYDPAVLEALELAFSKKGMPLWIARGHVARVNAIAAELAAGDRYRYEFGPELDVVVIDGDKRIHPRTASGSSRQRGALVLLVSLALYLQELAQISIPFLWIDEIPFQDEANQELLVGMLRHIGKRVPKLVFGASDWHSYEGKFDHQVGLTPVKAKTDATTAAPKPASAPVVTTYAAPVDPIIPLSKIEEPAKDAVDRMVAKPNLPTFDELEDKISRNPPAIDPLLADIPNVTPIDDIDDPF